jgi:hypothetical protein
MGDLLEVFEADDGEGGCSETMFAEILSGAGLALRGTGAGGFLRIQTIGGELFFGDGLLEALHGGYVTLPP